MASKPAPTDIPPEMPASPSPDAEPGHPPRPDDPVPDPDVEPWIEGP